MSYYKHTKQDNLKLIDSKMPVFSRRELGKLGEDVATFHLFRKNYVILNRNILTPFGEIDILCIEDGFFVFVEVRCVFGNFLSDPLESITEKKKRHILNNCLYYIQNQKIEEEKVRIDVVSAKFSKTLKLEHIEIIKNAFCI